MPGTQITKRIHVNNAVKKTIMISQTFIVESKILKLLKYQTYLHLTLILKPFELTLRLE